MEIRLSEIQITPVKPRDGLLAFSSFVLAGSFSVGGVAGVRGCPVRNCPLYPYRMGRNPYHGLSSRQGKGSHSWETGEKVGVC